MIEFVSANRCTGCNICVAVCPVNVFDAAVPDGPPVIARQSACQTCFMCELYCPEDALFVAPDAVPCIDLEVDASLVGSYRRAVGWGRDGLSTARDDASFELLSRAR